MFENYVNVLKKYAVFEGRASRRELWSFILINMIITYVLAFFLGSVVTLYSLAVAIPLIALWCRRMHDTDRSGHWLWLCLTGIGSILILIWGVTEGTHGPNRFGPDPYGQGGAVRRNPSPSNIPPIPSIQDYGPTAPYQEMNVHATGRTIQVFCEGGIMAGRCYQVGPDGLMFGRDGQSNVQFPDQEPGISRRHCVIFYQDGEFYLMDQGSTYGTFLERYGKLSPQQPVKLQSGDVFYIASKKTRFSVR